MRPSSIHVSMDNGLHAMDPIEANDRILRKLDEAVAQELGDEGLDKEYHFYGGNPSSIDSCVALVYAAEHRNLKIGGCLLPANSENTYVDAMLVSQGGKGAKAKFYCSQGVES